MPMKTNNLVACPECDALQREATLGPGAAADCIRCGAELYRNKPDSLEHTFAFMTGAAVALVCANVFPLMELDAQGLRTTSTIYGLVQSLYATGWPSIATLVLFTVIVVPLVQVGASLYLLGSLRFGLVPHGLRTAIRTVDAVWRWGMVEVFLLGAMVSMVKLTKLADVYVGWALYAVGAYIVLITAAAAAFDQRAIWERVAQLRAPRVPAAHPA